MKHISCSLAIGLLSFLLPAIGLAQDTTNKNALTALLELASIHCSSQEIEQCKDSIEQMKQTLLRRTPAAASTEEKVTILNSYLFGPDGFTYTKSLDNFENVLLPSVVKTKKGNCLGLSCLYLCLGDALGLNLSGAEVPSHFFLILRDGKTTRNIDMAANGEEKPNSAYCERFHVSDRLVGKVYLRELTLEELIATMRGNLGVAYWKAGQNNKAIELIRTALKLQKDNPLMWSNLGSFYGSEDRDKEAIECFLKAISIDPDQAQFHSNLAGVYELAREFQLASVSYEKAAKLDPELSRNPAICKARARTCFIAANQAIQAEKFSLAIRQFELFVKIAPARDSNIGNAYNNLAIACYMAKDFKKARINAQMAAENGSPVDKEVSDAIAEALRNQ